MSDNTSNNPDEHKASKVVGLFAISPIRLAILSVLTLGWYEVYWFYRNWEALKGVDKEVKHPVWRAIFTIFYCFALFKTILKAAKKLGYKGSYSPGTLATFYIIIILVSKGWSRAENIDKTTDIILLIAISLSFLPLLYVQNAINHINNHQKLKTIRRFTIAEVVIIIIGMIIATWSVYATVASPHVVLSPEQQTQSNQLKDKSDSLYSQYQICTESLRQRQDTIDTEDQVAVDSYNADYDSCEAIRVEQNKAADDYNNLNGQ